MRNQPIYNNEKLKQAGKYNFDNVNTINRRIGEMEFDSSIKKDNKEQTRRIIITSIISGILILITVIFAFTDLKYILFPKKEEVIENTDFENLNVLHQLSCSIVLEQEGLKISVDKLYEYNNNKLKLATYTYTIDVTNEKLLSDNSFIDYMNDSLSEIENKYSNIEGLNIKYIKEGTVYKLIQSNDLRVIETEKISSDILDVYLDQDINNVKTTQERAGMICKQLDTE